MGLSRLENFLKNVRGNILYVSQNDLDATDSIENKGNSLTRPFKTIQRALIEAARFSYQSGLNNDRFAQTTILLFPGDHIIDNRPGYIPDGSGNFRTRFGSTTSDFQAWDLTTNYELANVNNALHKLNSIHGGVIVPRGTSLVGLDLRKTKIRPKYVPNPLNDGIESSAIFRVTGASYFWQFSIFDADPNGVVYMDYTENTFRPDFSHHKLTAFEYADGVNKVKINDTYQTYGSNTRTDLDMYYEKVGLVYGVTSGRQIEPDYPSTGLDIQPKIDEFRITGPKSGLVGISSIKAGDGNTTSNIITVTTTSSLSGVDVDTAIVIDGITATGYDGQHVVTDKISDTVFKYSVQNSPSNALPSVSGSTVALTIDTVTSASPYIFNISLRSVYGMGGLLADGNKASGFASMMVAQFTGIGLQKDNNAFLKYNATTGAYDDGTVSGNENLNTDSRAVYKPSYSGSHIKAINGATIQAASVFAIGYAEHFLAETGSEMSITNSNSNFGAKALVAEGFKKNAFSQDDVGYITHIIPPKEFSTLDKTVEFQTLDIATTVGVGTTSERLYLRDQTNPSVKPENVLDGYRIGAGSSDRLNVLLPISAGITSEFSSRIVMPNSQSSGEKSFIVNRSAAGINSITSNQFELTAAHTFLNGESIRIISENGALPDGLESNQVYFAITTGISTNIGLKVAKTLTDAENASALTINNLGGPLKIVSRVSDKNSGDIGHPIQYDNVVKNQWYINVGVDTHNVGTAASDRKDRIYTYFVNKGTSGLGNASPRSYIKRKSDERQANDTTYRLRYVIPAATGVAVARPPSSGYILQESNTSIGSTNSEVQTYFGTENFTNVAQQRNFSFIAQANYTTGIATFVTEQPHKLTVGSLVETVNINSGNNSTGLGNSGFNGTFRVSGITSARGFTVGLSTDPGTFTVINTISRNTDLPHFKRKEYKNTYYIQDTEEIQEYVQGTQDGVYYLTVLNSSVSPTVSPFTGEKFTQPIKYLYPQVNRDNPVADPDAARSHALSRTIGETAISDVRNSLTKETLNKFLFDQNVGVAVTNIITTPGIRTDAGATTTHIPKDHFQYPLSKSHTIFTNVDHGLSGIKKVSIASSGGGYGTGGDSDEVYYNAQLVNSAELGFPTVNVDGNANAVGVGSTTGSHATARVTVDKNQGGITAITIMNPGSAFGIGNTMYVTGIGTHSSSVGTGHSAAKITVEKVNNNIGDVIRISGVTSETYSQYNDLYRISHVAVGAARSFSVIGNAPVTGVSTAGIGTVVCENAILNFTGQSIGISTYAYNPVTGIATVGTSTYHGLSVNSKIRVAISTVGVRTDGDTGVVPSRERGAFTGEFIITKDTGDLRFEMNIGIGVTTASSVDTGYSQSTLDTDMFIIPRGFASNDGTPTVEDESLTGRMVSIYDGVSTFLDTAMTKTTTEMRPVGLGLTNQIGVNIGDYYQIDDEIVRIKNNPHAYTTSPTSGEVTEPSNPLTVFRAVLGTRAAAHSVKSVIRKVKPIPVELRRQSINRATGHTFEYLGFGPGNYSTALPERQDRNLSEAEELTGQSLRKNGGVNYFSGTNDRGILFAGNKKLDPIAGKEEIHSTPIRTVTGEDISVKKGINIVKATEGEFSSSINVTGGDNNKAISEFKGPVVFNNKLTSTSSKGIEATSLFLQGDATVSKKYTVGISTPTSAGTAGDISFNNNPQGGKYLGWVYTTDNAWKRFGSISTATNFDYHTFDAVTSPIFNPTGIVTARFESNVSMGASLGVGTVFSRGAVDFGSAGSVTERFAIMPRVTTSERGNLAGIQTGAIIYNTTTSKFQGYASGAWVDLH